MKGFKEPGFQDRTAEAARAKEKALEKMKAAPKPDEAELAARAARREERNAKATSKRAAAEEAKKQREREKCEKALEAEREQAKAVSPEPTDAERQAARDARYAARKIRKFGRS